MKHFKSQQLSERTRIMAGWPTRQVSRKTGLVSDCELKATPDLMQMAVLNTEPLQKKLVCCGALKANAACAAMKLVLIPVVKRKK